MGKGLVLAALQLVSQNQTQVTHKFVFDTISNIDSASGLTRLCSDYIFFLFSKYNDKTGVGSNIINLLGAPILRANDKNMAVVQIVDEIDDATERFKILQTKSNIPVPAEELLETVRIVNITVDALNGDALIEIEIVNSLGQKAHIQL